MDWHAEGERLQERSNEVMSTPEPECQGGFTPFGMGGAAIDRRVCLLLVK